MKITATGRIAIHNQKDISASEVTVAKLARLFLSKNQFEFKVSLEFKNLVYIRPGKVNIVAFGLP